LTSSEDHPGDGTLTSIGPKRVEVSAVSLYPVMPASEPGRRDLLQRSSDGLHFTSSGANSQETLITPALFSRPSTPPPGEKREGLVLGEGKTLFQFFQRLTAPLSPRRAGRKAGREGLGE
jgi:hypothetical protein